MNNKLVFHVDANRAYDITNDRARANTTINTIQSDVKDYTDADDNMVTIDPRKT